MEFVFFLFFGGVILLAVNKQIQKNKRKKQAQFIEHYVFPPSINDKIKSTYPHLSDQQVNLVMDGLREYFQICRQAKKSMVSMPSQAVDLAWHEFILFTKHYEAFCKQGLGFFLHHTPAQAMASPKIAQKGVKNAWSIACQRANIPGNKPNRLPLIFAIDKEFAIPDGFYYTLDCTDNKEGHFCATHIGSHLDTKGKKRRRRRGRHDRGSYTSEDHWGDDNFDSCGTDCGGDSSSCGGGCGGD